MRHALRSCPKPDPTTNAAVAQRSVTPPRIWQVRVFSQRELDFLDTYGMKAAERGRDPLHHSMWWNISQNVGRTDTFTVPGITSCSDCQGGTRT